MNFVTKDEFAEALRAYQDQSIQDGTKSEWRSEALLYRANPSQYWRRRP